MNLMAFDGLKVACLDWYCWNKIFESMDTRVKGKRMGTIISYRWAPDRACLAVPPPPKKKVETQQHDARFIESRFQETRESRVPIAPFYFHGSHYFTLPRQGQSLATGPGPPAVLRTPRTALKICRPEMDWKQKCVQLPSDRQSANLASFCWRISWKTYLCVWQISWVQASTNERPAGKSSAIGGVNLVLYF